MYKTNIEHFLVLYYNLTCNTILFKITLGFISYNDNHIVTTFIDVFSCNRFAFLSEFHDNFSKLLDYAFVRI